MSAPSPFDSGHHDRVAPADRKPPLVAPSQPGDVMVTIPAVLLGEMMTTLVKYGAGTGELFVKAFGTEIVNAATGSVLDIVCPDCAVKPGVEHKDGCDLARLVGQQYWRKGMTPNE